MLCDTISDKIDESITERQMILLTCSIYFCIWQKKWSVLELRRTAHWLHTILVFYWCCQEKWINEEFRLELRCHMWKTVESCKIAMKNCYKTGLHDATIRRRITISNIIKWFYGFKVHFWWNQVEWQDNWNC